MDVPRWPLQPTRPSREEQMDRQVDRQRARHWIGSTDYVSSGAKTPENFSVDTGSPANLTTDSPFPVSWPLEDQTLSKIKTVQETHYISVYQTLRIYLHWWSHECKKWWYFWLWNGSKWFNYNETQTWCLGNLKKFNTNINKTDVGTPINPRPP